MQLPASLSLEQPVALELPISDDLSRLGAAGRVHEVILRIRLMRATDRDRLSFKLNGDELPAHIMRKIDHIYQMTAPRYRSHSSYWFVFWLDEAHWPVQGNQRRRGHLTRPRPGGYAAHLCAGRGDWRCATCAARAPIAACITPTRTWGLMNAPLLERAVGDGGFEPKN